jgi:hypothetical protein
LAECCGVPSASETPSVISDRYSDSTLSLSPVGRFVGRIDGKLVGRSEGGEEGAELTVGRAVRPALAREALASEEKCLNVTVVAMTHPAQINRAR